MGFADDLREEAHNVNSKTEFEEDIDVFMRDFKRKCEEAAKSGRFYVKTYFGICYTPQKYQHLDGNFDRRLYSFSCEADARPYKDAILKKLAQLGFRIRDVQIVQDEMHIKGLFNNGINYFFKQMYDRDYHIEIYVEW